MEGTNFRTFYQMKGFVNDQAKQALGIDSVQTLDMKWVTVGQNKRLVQGAVEETARATFAVNYPGSLKSLKVSMEPQQDLHGYANPWPAGGGSNIWDEQWERGLISPETGNNVASDIYCRTKNFIPVSPGETVYIFTTNASQRVYLRLYANDKTFMTYVQLNGKVNYTVPENCYYIRFCWDGTDYSEPMAVNYPASITTYSPYSNICPITGYSSVNVYHSGEDTTDYETVTVTFPAEPGTVYGGTLDLVTGELTVDRKSVIYDGSNDEIWYVSGSTPWRYAINVSDIKLGNALSHYVKSNLMKTTTDHWSTANYGILNNMDSIVVGYPPASNDVEAYKAFLSENPLQVVYLLATPVTYQLTAQDIETLTGENNIWSDAGNVTVEYYDLEEVP